MSYVVDTDVRSHTSPSGARSIPGLRDWLERNSERLHLSVVSLTEISYGIAWLRHRRATRKATLLQACLEDLIAFQEPRIIEVDDESRCTRERYSPVRAPAAPRSTPRTH